MKKRPVQTDSEPTGIATDQALSSTAAVLRRKAEERLQGSTPGSQHPRTVDESLRLVHELEVHQIELEMQNAELRQAREELEVSRDRYAELYDFAPVGYFTLDARGVIRETNLAGARLIGVERKILTGRTFHSFIADAEGREIFSRHLAAVLQTRGMQRCELTLTSKDGTKIHALVQSVAEEEKEEGKEQCILSSILDATASELLAEELKKSHDKLELMVRERTRELTEANAHLIREIEKRKNAEESLRGACEEIRRMKVRLQAENSYLQQEVAGEYNFGEIIGRSNAIEYVFFRVEQVAPQDATVLLLGETGTGKGVIARAIHSRSRRKDRPMITINCTALPGNLIESELFGRERGAFTGAVARQIGRFELADGGTIFLDEIGEMPLDLAMQALAGDPGWRVRATGQSPHRQGQCAHHRGQQSQPGGRDPQRQVPGGSLLPAQCVPHHHPAT